MSDYFNGLKREAQARYQNKISAIDHYDPYTLLQSDLNISLKDLPELHAMDIISYFVMRKSFCTEKQIIQIKAFKSLDAYKYYDVGFIQSIRCAKISDNFFAIGEVKHSQRMNDPKLKPWIIILPDGSIDSAHCTCMAGLGEACSHVAAIAFAIHLKGEAENELSATDKLCLWNVPVVESKITPQPIRNIDWGRKIKSYRQTQKLKNITPLTGDSLTVFLIKCEKAEPKAVIFNLMPPFADQRVPKVFNDLPQSLSNVYDPKYEVCSLEELRNLDVSFQLSKEEQVAVLNATLSQFKSNEWYKQRNGRITSSSFKSACTTSIDKPSRTLINSVCYGAKTSFKNKPLAYGLDNEDNARRSYLSYMALNHQNVNLSQTGFIISVKLPIFGSSVDALVTCECCGSGCCELKCPYRMHELDLDIEEFVKLKNCYIKKDSNGKLELDKTHQYYYRVQMHMFCTETTYCDFVVWSKKDLYVERINIDTAFLQSKLQKAYELHKNVIVPELLAKWYTKSRDQIQVIAWCECCSPENGEPMIKCCNEQCQIQWFHVKCVMPVQEDYDELEWYCNVCRGKSVDPMDWD